MYALKLWPSNLQAWQTKVSAKRYLLTLLLHVVLRSLCRLPCASFIFFSSYKLSLVVLFFKPLQAATCSWLAYKLVPAILVEASCCFVPQHEYLFKCCGNEAFFGTNLWHTGVYETSRNSIPRPFSRTSTAVFFTKGLAVQHVPAMGGKIAGNHWIRCTHQSEGCPSLGVAQDQWPGLWSQIEGQRLAYPHLQPWRSNG